MCILFDHKGELPEPPVYTYVLEVSTIIVLSSQQLYILVFIRYASTFYF